MKKVVLYIFLSALFFSTMEVTLKVAGCTMDPFQLTLIRFLIGGIFLLPFAIKEIKKKNTKLEKKDYLYMLMLGTICIPISMVFFQLGVANSNASTAAVIFCVNPLFTMAFAHFVLDERLNRKRIMAITIATVGIFFMAKPWNMAEGNTTKGLLFIIAAAVVFGLYSVLGKRSIAKIGCIPQTSISFILGSIVMIIVNVIFKKPIIEGITLDIIPLLLYISIFITGMGYLFYFLAIEASDAATGSIVFFIKPVLAPLFAVIMINETIGWNGFLGITLILIGSFINLRDKLKSNIGSSAEEYKVNN